jgi:hypothetical protein
LELLASHPKIKFKSIVAAILQAYMLRETNVKDICLNLATLGKIENTWGAKPKKPNDGDLITLVAIGK